MLAPVAITRIEAPAVIKKIPLENTKRWPRCVKRRGKKPSLATILTIFGKALKQVLAPAKRINIVPNCVRTKSAPPSRPSPRAAFATSEITVGVPSAYGTATVSLASQAIPTIKVAKVALMRIRTFLAFTCSGDLKSGTLSEIASIPVSEALPLANAFNIKSTAATDKRPWLSPIGTRPSVSVW